MGLSTEIICPACGYYVLTDAGPSGGFRVFTNTYICLNCRSLVDLVTGHRDDENQVRRKDPPNIHEGHSCLNCNGSSFILWDIINKPCPKCGTKMSRKLQWQKVIFWD